MIPFAAPSLASGNAFASFSQTFTTTGGQTVAKPVGATTAILEGISGGNNGTQSFDGSEYTSTGGYGGGYSKRTISVASVTNLYIMVGTNGAATSIRLETSVGTSVLVALIGPNSGGTGDVKYDGGAGSSNYGYTNAAGGGAAGPNGNGFPATSPTTPGSGNGFPAGSGGAVGDGTLYGGGGGVAGTSDTKAGAQGWAKVTWS